MTDIVLIVVIVAFFVAGALLIRVLDRLITGSGLDAETDDETSGPSEGRPS